MSKTKPLTYPNLVTTLNAVADTHAAVHTTVAEHAQTHADKHAERLKALEIKHEAHALMTGEVKQ